MHLPAEEKRHVAEISCCAGGTETHVFQNGSKPGIFIWCTKKHIRNTSIVFRDFECFLNSGQVKHHWVSILPTDAQVCPWSDAQGIQRHVADS